jgi:hypothetical protein
MANFNVVDKTKIRGTAKIPRETERNVRSIFLNIIF